ncbi:heterokaryon incompatibility protein-domain-containing protein [Annulohypoxylon maeteangense]|uniref:heterokaryon incompatibility protein-domain-containing protein n=1 Tax=Annulohypoxylon maeteangense TaxID=1927788 RepID=UPI002007DE7C|nr:heterokaryon incompatibility protein-domain-containing protein [Annulohypoxylon maeteangense]KAI0884041.1 heterokaryon incompatibility protein-domain-containing protein [Annulohypoxylon maeteangense]
MDKSTNTVNYNPLPEDGSQIRLITILPGGKHKKVKCTVSNFPFVKNASQNPEYEALSYVWGDATITTSITLNSRPFQVTTNLEAALRALRLRNKKRLVWVDAICIDQTSIPERNQEVRRMGEIYSRANNVVVWLGRAQEPNDGEQLDDDRIADKLHGVLDTLANLQSENDEAAAALLDRTGNPIYAIRLLHRFFYRPWFNRIWVLQEITLAKTATIMYGDMRIGWDRLVQAVDALRRLQIGQYTYVWRLSGASKADSVQRCWMRTRGATKQSEHPSPVHLELADLLWQTRFHEWTEPRDRLFGILGLVKGDLRGEKLLEVDYMKPVADVFKDLSIYMVQGGMLSHLLCSIVKPVDGLPSWASNWIADLQGETATRLSKGLMIYMQIYEFKGVQQPLNPPRLSDDLCRITIKGAIVDYGIGHIGKRFEPFLAMSIEERARAVRTRLIEWEDEMESQHCAHQIFETQAERREAWKSAVLHELLGDETELGHHYDLMTDRENEIRTDKDYAFLMKIVTNFDSTLGLSCDYIRPFVTVSGLMGSTGTKSDLRSGDQVSILVGSGVPYILRPVDQTRDLYKFVGCCWMPGLMDFDAVEGEREGYWKPHDITLI